MRRRRAVTAFLAAALLAGAAAPGARAQGGDPADEPFLAGLEAGRGEAGGIDRPRLGRVVFGAAAQLLGGTANVGLLRARVVPRDPSQASVVEVAAARYDEYRAAVDGLRAAASALLDEPESDRRLFAALAEGQRACWLLDRFSRLVETYGASSADLMTVLSSTEACVTLRRVAFAPAVRAAVETALGERESAVAEAARLRAEVADLEVELAELEALLRDLAAIDGAAGGE